MACTRDTTISWNEIDTEWQNYDESWCLDLPTIAFNRQITTQLAVGRTDGTTYEDVSDYLDYAEVELGDIEQVGTGNVAGDAVVRNMRFELRNNRNATGGDSLHPLDKDSSFNQFNSAYNPLLWPLRETVLRVAVQSQPAYSQPKGTTEQFSEFVADNDGTSNTYNLDYGPTLPASEVVYVDGVETTNYTIDYDAIPSTLTTSVNGEVVIDYTYFRPLFAGYMGDSIQSADGGSVIEVQCRDYAKLLQDTFIETKREYGSESGTLAQTVIQNILDDNLDNPPTLYTPSDPGFDVLPYEVDYQSVWDAIQQVASQFGWFLGYLWDTDTLQWRLTLKEPPREKTTGDYTLTAQDDIYTRDLDITDSDIRNVVNVEYRDESTGEKEVVTVSDTDSINEFRRRSMTIGTKDTPLIDTSSEATAFGNALLNDLKDISSTTNINIPLFPEATLYTGYDVDDPRLESEVNFYATESVRHTLDFNPNGSLRTEIVAGGSVIGSKSKWLRMETRPGAGEPIPPERIGGGSKYMPVPTGVVANDLKQGIEVEFNAPAVHQNRWAESKVYVSSSSGIDINNSATYDFTKTGKQTYFQLYDNINAGQTYYIKVTFIDMSNFIGEASVEVNATAQFIDGGDFNSTPPSVPTNLTLNTGIDNISQSPTVYIESSWDANSESDLSYYQVRFKKSSINNWTEFNTTTNSQRISSLIPSINYDVAVRAIDVTGNKSNWSATQTINTASNTSAPSGPSGVTASGIKLGITIGFTKPSDSDWADSRVYVSSSSGINVNDSNTYDFIKEGRQTYFEITDNINPGVTYYMKVTHIDVDGNESVASTEVSATAQLTDSGDIVNGAITETKIADDSISTPKLQANSVTSANISAIDADIVTITAGGGTVTIDDTGVNITGGDLTVTNSGGEVIIDGESKMFKVSEIITGTFTSEGTKTEYFSKSYSTRPAAIGYHYSFNEGYTTFYGVSPYLNGSIKIYDDRIELTYSYIGQAIEAPDLDYKVYILAESSI